MGKHDNTNGMTVTKVLPIDQKPRLIRRTLRE